MDLPHGYKCVFADCPYYAIYDGDERPLYCDFHHPNPDAKVKPTYKGYKHRICIEPTCGKRSSFNYELGMKQIFCQDHIQPNMINVASVKCRECKKNTARYTYRKNYPKALLCRECRDKKTDKDGIVDCYETLCNPPNCWTQACFGNNRFDKNGWRCKEHRSDGMIDVKNIHTLCTFGGCGVQANFGFEGEKAIRCKDHKDVGMIDKYHDICQYEGGCNVRASYNYEGNWNKGLYCVRHKLANMVDVVSTRCKECNLQPCFNFQGEKVPIYCQTHAKPKMVNVRQVKCNHPQCKESSHALYGFVGKNPERCRLHIEDGMIKYPRRICVYRGCTDSAIYGFIGTFPMYCEIHKSTEHDNLLEQKCKSCGMLYIVDKEYKCIYCSPLKKTQYLTKQRNVRDFLENMGYKWIMYDREIDGGACGRERPDFVFECIGYYCVLEVDEYQHTHYTDDCEIVRMINISQSLGMPTIFIRYNPDRYSVGNNLTDTDTRVRLEKLVCVLNIFLNLNIDNIAKFGYCSVIYLFYNEYNEGDLHPITLVHFET